MTYGIAVTQEDGPVDRMALDAGSPIAVALCGSFRRDEAGLRREYEELLEAGCRVISPADIRWVEERDGFVLAEHERNEEPEAIEQAHLSAMRAADFVWLHAPNGYVGRSSSMELGYAHALGLPILAQCLPDDATLASLVEKVDSVEMAVAHATSHRAAPALGLDALQHYYARAAAARGWTEEDAQQCLGLLTEEVGELHRAIRKQGVHSTAAAFEMADVQLYLTHLANITNTNLGRAVVEKEQINAARFGPALVQAA